MVQFYLNVNLRKKVQKDVSAILLALESIKKWYRQRNGCVIKMVCGSINKEITQVDAI